MSEDLEEGKKVCDNGADDTPSAENVVGGHIAEDGEFVDYLQDLASCWAPWLVL